MNIRAHVRAHHRKYGLCGVLGASAVAALYLVVIPHEAAAAFGPARFLLMYGHSLCWVLIALASGWWAVTGAITWSARLLYAAAVLYICFLLALLF